MTDSHSDNTRRIAKNTLALYVRMLFGMLVSLYTSRVILNALGVVDFGIQNVVGGVVGMLSLISASLSSATSRFLTFELGKGDITKLKQVFSTALIIHLALAGIIFVVAETVGLWFLNTQMTIPAERMYAANWVYQNTILSFILGLLSIPFNSSIISHERMTAFAYFGILDIILRLCVVLFIAYVPFSFDKLIVFSCLFTAVGITMQTLYFIFCRRNFEECRINIKFDKQCWKEMSGFATWNFIGCTAGLLKDQGVNILLNIFIGPVLNAARGIAGQVNNAVSAFAGNFMTALNPQITKSYAADDREYMFSLVERGSRFSFYIMLILALPILFETNTILTIWLKEFPEHTINFVRLIIVLTLSDILSNTLITLQNATGKIRNYQIAVGGMLMMNFPLSYLFLRLGFAPECTLLVAIVVSVACMMLRLLFLRKMAGLSMRRFLKNVYFNVISVTALSAIVPAIAYKTIPEGLPRFFSVVAISIVSSCAVIYFVGCNSNEREFLLAQIKKAFTRFRHD